MEVKALEIRDSMTFIPVAAVLLTAGNEGQRYLLSRAGLGKEGSYLISLTKLTSGEGHINPYSWPDYPSVRTMAAAHEYIEEHWAELDDGDVVDVEFILGLSGTPKISERFGEFGQSV